MEFQDRFKTWGVLMRSLPDGASVCEVGVWKGEFSEKMMSACPNIGSYILVDPWRHLQDWNKPFNLPQSEMDTVYDEAMRRVEPFKDRVRVIRKKSFEAAKSIPDSSLDIVYIDGDHTCRGIVTDLIAWWPKVRPGGILGGDDFVEGLAQHGHNYDPTMVRPAVLGFVDATPGAVLEHNATQFSIRKPKPPPR